MRNRTSLVVAVAALVVALGGTSYAALGVGKNTVGPTQLKANSVGSAKGKDRSLLPRDFKPGQLPAGATGPAGPAGAPGADGAPGPAGPTQGKAHGFFDPPAKPGTLTGIENVDVTMKT